MSTCDRFARGIARKAVASDNLDAAYSKVTLCAGTPFNGSATATLTCERCVLLRPRPAVGDRVRWRHRSHCAELNPRNRILALLTREERDVRLAALRRVAQRYGGMTGARPTSFQAPA